MSNLYNTPIFVFIILRSLGLRKDKHSKYFYYHMMFEFRHHKKEMWKWDIGFKVVFSNMCSFVYFISVSWTKIMGKQFIFSLIYLWVVCLQFGSLPTFSPDIILIDSTKLHVTIFLMNDREANMMNFPQILSFLLIVKGNKASNYIRLI